MKKLKYLFLTLTLFLCVAAAANAQTPKPTPDPTLVACEEIADKAKRLTIENESLKSLLQIEKDRNALEKDRTANKEEQVQFYKLAYEKASKIDTNSGMVIENLRFQVNDYKNEVADLRRENEKLRGSRSLRTVISAGLGFGLGYYLGNK